MQDLAPIIAFSLAPPGVQKFHYSNFDLTVRNVGRGPAFDVSLSIRGEGRTYQMTARVGGLSDFPVNQRPLEPLVLPLTLAAGETMQLNVTSDWDGRGGIKNPEEWAVISADYRDIFSGGCRSSATINGTGLLESALGSGGPALSPLQYRRIASGPTAQAST